MKSHIHIEVGSKQTIINATKEEVEFIKEDLTFENPKHKSAMKYSGYSFTRIPKYLTFYKRIKTEYLGKEVTALEVPRFFNIKKCLEKRGIETSLIGCHFTTDKKTTIYPTFKMELRKNQNDAIEAYLREFNTTLLYPKSIIQLPTGKGKTILAIHLASRIHAKTIVLVHKTDLVVGWTKDIKQCFDDIDVGIIQAGKKHISDFITIATFQTLHRMSEEERQELFNSFDLVIFDEVHHLNPDMFGVIDEFNSRYKLGLSATPVRSDGMNYLFDIYLGGLVYQYEYTEDEEDICGAQVIITPTKYRYRPFIYEGRVFNYYSFSEDELPEYCTFVEDLDYSMRPKIPHQQIDSDRVNDPKFMFKVCKQILNEYRQGRSILALFNLKEDVRVYQRFLSNFIPKNEILLYYGDSKDKVDVMLEKAESKECHITLATYSKAKEGTNVKAWEVLFLVSSINDAKNTEQAVGRIRRKSDNKLDMVRIYDYPATDVYSMGRHIRTRLEVYKKLHFTGDVNWGQKSRDNLFSRGY